MRKGLLIFLVCLLLALPAEGTTYTAPSVPESGAYIYPSEPETFSDGLQQILQDASLLIRPAVIDALAVCVKLIGISLLLSVFHCMHGNTKQIQNIVGTIAIATILLQPSRTMLKLGLDTVNELSSYGRLLLPVMTGAVAAEGGAGTSTTLYLATAAFDALLCSAITELVVPMLYVFLCLCVAKSVLHQDLIQKMAVFTKWVMTWSLKLILYIFMGYISLSGIASGKADAAALKAAKLTISGMVPVVGSILSDASETILVSAGAVKSAAGIYGLLAIICVFIGPFIQIGVQYLLLKATSAICTGFSLESGGKLIQDFSTAMGVVLAMIGTMGMLLFISTVCFMKGVS